MDSATTGPFPDALTDDAPSGADSGPLTLSRRDLARLGAIGLAAVAGGSFVSETALASPAVGARRPAGPRVGTASTYRTITAPVACLWRSPASPRAVDALAVRRSPDIPGWLRRLDALPRSSGRLGLVGRLDSQLLQHEPVLVVRTRADGWSEVRVPWAPCASDPRGYPGWIAPGHISSRPWRGALLGATPVVTAARARTTFLDAARSRIGRPYLWGGTSPIGLDCSGLVLWSARQVGVQVPRDADDQLDAARRIPLSAVRPGDLYFFAKRGKRPHHVGIVLQRGVMLNAPQTGTRVRIERVTGSRARTLVAAGRFAGLA